MALLDDVAVIARAAAASIDDVSVAAGKAGTKAAGVVIDDAAVTPGYVTGLSPARELPIIWAITKGSLKNKLFVLLPGALALSWLLPEAIIYLLMIGGAYLSYEGAEKILEKLGEPKHGQTLDDVIDDPLDFENHRIKGAIRTDMILSAEIVAISLNEIAAMTDEFWVRAGALAAVGVAITVAVYGAVALIVKMDDIGLHLVEREAAVANTVGRALIHAMPRLLVVLSAVGTVAMLWVGGGIILHGMEQLGLHAPADVVHSVQHAVEHATGALGGVLGWLSNAAISALFGVLLGALIVFMMHHVLKVGGH